MTGKHYHAQWDSILNLTTSPAYPYFYYVAMDLEETIFQNEEHSVNMSVAQSLANMP